MGIGRGYYTCSRSSRTINVVYVSSKFFTFLVVYNNWHEFELPILEFVYVFALLSSKSRGQRERERERRQINFFVVCHGVCSFHANGIIGRREMKRLRGDKMDAQMWQYTITMLTYTRGFFFFFFIQLDEESGGLDSSSESRTKRDDCACKSIGRRR